LGELTVIRVQRTNLENTWRKRGTESALNGGGGRLPQIQVNKSVVPDPEGGVGFSGRKLGRGRKSGAQFEAGVQDSITTILPQGGAGLYTRAGSRIREKKREGRWIGYLPCNRAVGLRAWPDLLGTGFEKCAGDSGSSECERVAVFNKTEGTGKGMAKVLAVRQLLRGTGTAGGTASR